MTVLIICLCVLAVLIFAVLVSRNKIYRVYAKYSKVQNTAEMTGSDLAIYYKQVYDMDYLSLAHSEVPLSDCYVPKKKLLVMSDEVAYNTSVASLGIVSHEFGHALQHKTNNQLFHLTYILQKITRITNLFIIPLFIVGMIMTLFNLHYYNIGEICLYVSISLFIFHIALKLATIPLEYNASDRALKMLIDNKLVSNRELGSIKKLLKAAALTYVAGLFSGFIILPKKLKKFFVAPFSKKK